jgi:septal ring factor EnvC (AmiA/AmiB activator)
VKKTGLLHKIRHERNKAVSQYTNLQAKKEQLHLLIGQLENLSGARCTNLLNWLNTELNNELDYFETTSKTIRNELQNAIKEREEITSDLNYLRDKIILLEKRLKK